MMVKERGWLALEFGRRLGARIGCRARALLRSPRGGVAMVFGLAVIPLFAMVGLAVDGGRAYMAKSRLQAAVDAASLAGGHGFSMAQAQASADARMYFDANYASDYLGGELEQFTVTPHEDTGEFEVRAQAEIPTTFMRVLGIDTVEVSASSVAASAHKGLELAMVLDTTGSMLWRDANNAVKITSLKTAATSLVDILFGDDETLDDLWISIVPFTTAVNVGSSRTNWLTGYSAANFAPDTWDGCVQARAAPYDQDDTPPADQPFRAYLWPSDEDDNDWPPVSNNRGPNLYCIQNQVVSLTNQRETLEDAIDDLVASGGTVPPVGLVWGWRAISPSWRSLWGGATPNNRPLDYDDEDSIKAVVFMTDGQADIEPNLYTAYGLLKDKQLGTKKESKAEEELNDRLATICTDMKEAGIEIYTIMFALDDEDIETLYRNCASSAAHFFNSPTGEQLQAAFRQIGGRLSALRLAR